MSNIDESVYAFGGSMSASYRLVVKPNTLLDMAIQYYDAAVVVAGNTSDYRLNCAFLYLVKHCCECCINELERYPNMFKYRDGDKKLCCLLDGSKIVKDKQDIYVDVPDELCERMGETGLKARRVDIVQWPYNFVNVDYVLSECSQFIEYVKSELSLSVPSDVKQRVSLFNAGREITFSD